MRDWHIAQMNVATALYLLEDPRIAAFVAALDEVNALAGAPASFGASNPTREMPPTSR